MNKILIKKSIKYKSTLQLILFTILIISKVNTNQQNSNKEEINKISNLENKNPNQKQENNKNLKFLATNQNAEKEKEKEIQLKDPQQKSESKFLNFLNSTIRGFSVIYFAEIGDKTFFLIMIFSTDNNFLTTLLVASSVMLSWNFICMVIGSSIPVLLFAGFLDLLGMGIFFFFGFALLYSAYHMEDHFINKGLNETKSELSRKSSSLLKRSNSLGLNLVDESNLNEPLLNKIEKSKKLKESKSINLTEKEKRNFLNEEKLPINNKKNPIVNLDEESEEFGFHSPWAFASALAIAEFGDKTQISSIILGSSGNFEAVLLGTSIGRFLGVITAVLCGKFISNNITHKQVTYLSAFIFLFFGLAYLIKIFF